MITESLVVVKCLLSQNEKETLVKITEFTLKKKSNNFKVKGK